MSFQKFIDDFQKHQDEAAEVIYKQLHAKNVKLSFVQYLDLDEGVVIPDEPSVPLESGGISLFGDFKPFHIRDFEKILKNEEAFDSMAFEITVEVVTKGFPEGMTIVYSSTQYPSIKFKTNLKEF